MLISNYKRPTRYNKKLQKIKLTTPRIQKLNKKKEKR